MTIAEVRERCNAALGRLPKDLLIVSIVLLSGFLGFALGYLSGQESRAGEDGVGITASPDLAVLEDARVVASKNGTKYYLPWCGGADRISQENKVWFASPEAARQQGYAPAANCDGL